MSLAVGDLGDRNVEERITRSGSNGTRVRWCGLICVTESIDDEVAESLLRKLSRTPMIVSVIAYCLLRTFYRGPDGGHYGRQQPGGRGVLPQR